jgi:cytochrome c oxidase subunit 1
MSWLVTVDHKRLGVMYGVAVMFFFMVAGILAILSAPSCSRRTRTS